MWFPVPSGAPGLEKDTDPQEIITVHSGKSLRSPALDSGSLTHWRNESRLIEILLTFLSFTYKLTCSIHSVPGTAVGCGQAQRTRRHRPLLLSLSSKPKKCPSLLNVNPFTGSESHSLSSPQEAVLSVILFPSYTFSLSSSIDISTHCITPCSRSSV